MVDKSFECENASENAAERFDLVPYHTAVRTAVLQYSRTAGALMSVKQSSERKILF